MNEGFLNAVLSIATAAIGMFGVAMGLEGFFRGKIHWVLRIVTVVGGLLLIYPGIVTDLVGVICVGGVVLLQFLLNKKRPAAA